MTSKESLFIIGNPRSGTSLARLMLTNHPAICVPPECGFIQWWKDKYSDWTVADSLDGKRVREFVADLETSRKIETWSMCFDSLSDKLFERKPASYPALCREVIRHYAEENGRRVLYLGDKNNYYVEYLKLIVGLFPEAKYLCIVRDGRDVACSYRGLETIKTQSRYRPTLPTGIEKIARHWTSNNLKIVRHLLDPEWVDSKVVRFRELVTNSREVLEDVCEWLGLEYDRAMLSYAESDFGTHDEPEEFLAWKEKTIQAPDPSVVGKYVRQLGPDEIRRFEEIAEPVLRRFGYDLNSRG